MRPAEAVLHDFYAEREVFGPSYSLARRAVASSDPVERRIGEMVLPSLSRIDGKPILLEDNEALALTLVGSETLLSPKAIVVHRKGKGAARIRPGDRLWGRQAFAHVHPCQVEPGRFSLPSHEGISGPPPVAYRVIYRADGPYPGVEPIQGHPYRQMVKKPLSPWDRERGNLWEPNVHMPRWACRLELEVVSVGDLRLHIGMYRIELRRIP